MGRRGKNRDKRNLVLAQIEEADPDLYAELVALRSRDPASYRKRIRKLGEIYVIRSPQKLMANRGAWWHASGRDQLDVLEEHFQIVRAAVKRGYFDERLDALEAAERQGRDRPVIYQIIREREEALERLAAPKPAIPPAGGNWERDPDAEKPTLPETGGNWKRTDTPEIPELPRSGENWKRTTTPEIPELPRSGENWERSDTPGKPTLPHYGGNWAKRVIRTTADSEEE